MFFVTCQSGSGPFRFRRNRLVGILCILFFCLSALFAEAADALPDSGQTVSKETRKQLKRARKMIRKGELVEAETMLRQILNRAPGNADAQLNLARVYLKKKDLLEAYKLSYGVALKDPDNAFAFAILGKVLLESGNFRDAEISFRNALLIDKKEPFAWAGYGMLDFYENRLKESVKKLRTANYYKSNEPDFVYALARISARAEKYKQAADAYRKFLRISNRRDRERRERIKGLIRFLEFLNRRQSLYDVGGEKQTRVPIKLVGNRPVIQVRINRKDKPLNFVLDTGSGMTVISEKTADRLGINTVARGGKARAIGGSGKFDIVYGFLKAVEIGDVQVRNVPIYIRKFHGSIGQIDGYIGISVLSKFLTTIDYGRLEFTLIRKPEDTLLEMGEIPLPLRLTMSGFLSGTVKVKGIEEQLNFIVDTGASVSVISDHLARQSSISRYERDRKLRVIGAAGITEDVPAYTLPRVTIGSFSRDSLMAVALNLDIINETTGFEQAGILGGNFLKNYRITFDFKNSKVTFVPINK